MTALIYIASGLLGALVVGNVFVAGVLIGRAWDATTGANWCDEQAPFIPRSQPRHLIRGGSSAPRRAPRQRAETPM